MSSTLANAKNLFALWPSRHGADLRARDEGMRYPETLNT